MILFLIERETLKNFDELEMKLVTMRLIAGFFCINYINKHDTHR